VFVLVAWAIAGAVGYEFALTGSLFVSLALTAVLVLGAGAARRLAS